MSTHSLTAPIVEEVSSKKKSAEPEIITLTDSEDDDDTAPPPAKRPANGQTTPAPPTPASSTAAPGSTTPQGSGRWFRGACVSACVSATDRGNDGAVVVGVEVKVYYYYLIMFDLMYLYFT